MKTKYLLFSFAWFFSTVLLAQKNTDVTRVEYNAGTRTYREQVIITKDSVINVEEDFRKDKAAGIKRRKTTNDEWKNINEALKNVSISEISNLPSPTNDRQVDGAAHGSIIITTQNQKSFTHGFDNEAPNEQLKPLMKAIRKVSGNKPTKEKKHH